MLLLLAVTAQLFSMMQQQRGRRWCLRVPAPYRCPLCLALPHHPAGLCCISRCLQAPALLCLVQLHVRSDSHLSSSLLLPRCCGNVAVLPTCVPIPSIRMRPLLTPPAVLNPTALLLPYACVARHCLAHAQPHPQCAQGGPVGPQSGQEQGRTGAATRHGTGGQRWPR